MQHSESISLQQSIQDLFRVAEVSEFLEPFIDLTGCEDLDDLLNSSDEDIEEWMAELEMGKDPIKRILRYIQKFRDGDAAEAETVATSLGDVSSISASSTLEPSSLASSIAESIHPQAAAVADAKQDSKAAEEEAPGAKGSAASGGTTPVKPNRGVAASPLPPSPLADASASQSLIPPSPRGVPQSPLPKRYAAFLSHYKLECGTEARLLQQGIKSALESKKAERVDAFIDSDNLRNLNNLLDHVRESECLVLLQSKGVLTRPWCLLELYTAATCGIPILCLNIQGSSFPYDFMDAKDFMTHLDTRLEECNPGALEQLEEYGVSLEDCAYVLSNAIPNTISLPFNPLGTRNMIKASILDLVDNMYTAVTFNPLYSKEAWLQRRAKVDDDHEQTLHRSQSSNSSASAPPPAPEAEGAALPPPAPSPHHLAPLDTDAEVVGRGGGGGQPPGPSPNGSSTSSTSSYSSHADNSKVRRGEWRLGENIGRGAFGMVYKGMNTANGEIIAIKELNFDAGKKKQLKEMVKEVDLMRRLQHTNIVKYLGGQEDLEHGRLYIFTEFVAGGSVGALIKTYGALPEPVVRRYTAETLAGLVYIHSHKILHRDIKPDNVLINQSGTAKLADFGASSFKPKGTGNEDDEGFEATAADQASTLAGTPYFMSPEAIAQKGAGQRSDVWSFGGFVLNMASGQAPWRCLRLKGQFQLFTHINNSKRESPLEAEERVARQGEPLGTADFRDFLDKCFERNYDKRPYAATLEKHAFLRDPLLEDDQENGSGGEGSGDEGGSLAKTTAGIESLLQAKEAQDAAWEQRKEQGGFGFGGAGSASPAASPAVSPAAAAGAGAGAAASPQPAPVAFSPQPHASPSPSGGSGVPGSAEFGSKAKAKNPFGKKAKPAPAPAASAPAAPAAPAAPTAAPEPFGGASTHDSNGTSAEDQVNVGTVSKPPPPQPKEEEEEEEEEEDEEEEEEEEAVIVDIETAWQSNIITATQYQTLSRHNILQVDPKNLPEEISGLGGGRGGKFGRR